MTKQLSAKLQYLSFFSMMLVVFIHSTNTSSTSVYPGIIENFIADGIARIAVPVFFCMSGFLFFFNFQPTVSFYFTKFKKRFFTILIPYLIWSAWGLLLFFVLQTLPFTHPFFNKQLIQDYSFHKILYTLLVDPLTYQLWFLRDLMLLVLISPLLYFLLYYLRIVIILLFFLLWFKDVNLYIFSPESLLFFSVGCYFSIHAKSIDKHLPYAWASLIFWLFIIGLKTYLQAQPHYNMLYTVLLKKTSIITGMYAVWALYDRLLAGKSLSRQVSLSWLQCSFFLYVFHEPLLTIIKKVLLFFYGSGNVALVFAYFIVPILTILICVYTALMLKKIIPGVYNFVTGGR